jgi:RNA polymerase sigma-70 factor (ECF subfamily)
MTLAFTLTGNLFPARRSAAPADSVSDETLIDEIADRSHDAMRTLFLRHRLYVYRFILRMVGDEAAAEDLLSDVFLEVWREAERFNGRSAVATWLLGIARFKALSALRRRGEAQLDETAAAEIVDPADDAELVVAHRQRSKALRDALAQLPVAQREVIDLVYYHGRSIREVASIIKTCEATVKTRMFYARKRLAQLIGGEAAVTLH